MAQTISLDFYQRIEEKFGKELATEATKSLQEAMIITPRLSVALVPEATKSLQEAMTAIEQRAEQLAVQKKLELKDELTKELATKADIAILRSEIMALQGKFDGEIKSTEARLMTEIKTLNTKFNFIIAIMILALTAMNPVVAELLKKWLKI